MATFLMLFSSNLMTSACARAETPDWHNKLSTLRWVDYSPSTGNPNQGIEPSVDSIRQDLAVLRKAHFTGLVTYGSKGRLGNELLTLAKDAGFAGVVIGVWNPADADEVAAAKRATASEVVIGICMGNEGLMSHRYSMETLTKAIREIRTATKKPVTTTEIIQQYDATILGLVDWAFPNAHPYFANTVEPQSAVAWTLGQFRRLSQASSQLVVLKEVGLPTGGDAKQPLSEQAQCEYYEALAKTDVRFVYFEAFDLTWKSDLPVEPHWGIFHADRTPKASARLLTDGTACRWVAPVKKAGESVCVAGATPSTDTFYIYKDKDSPANHFDPKGRMGDVEDIVFQDDWPDHPESGSTCIKVTYSAQGRKPTCDYAGACGWAGVFWQEPALNWGKKREWESAGYNLSGYRRLKFWARADHPATVEFKVGGILGPYGDTLRPARVRTAHLRPEWTEYSIDLEGANLSYIVGGFAWTASKELNPSGVTFYIDEIRFVHD